MIISSRNARIRRWAAALLLAAYGSAGVLGYGLHAVWECDHHCHEHSQVEGVAPSHPHVQRHCCHHHHHDHELEVIHRCDNYATNLVADDCPICEFLVQAQSPFVLEVAVACAGPSHSFPDLLHDTYIAPLVGVHPARGPPLG